MLKRLRETEFADQSSEIRGADLFGTGNEKIGTIEDVIYDSDSSTATYAIVDTGWLKSRRFIVPSDYIRSRADDPNAFHVPLSRQQIEDLPQFDPDLLNSEERFTEYESRYRSKWKTYGLDMPATRDSRIQQFESRLRDRAVQPGRVVATVAGGSAIEGAISVYAVYHDQSKLEAAVDRLKTAGFDSNDISAVFPDKGRSEQFAMERNTKAPEGAATGGGTGIVVGGVLGWLAGIGTLAIPGIGPLLAAGPIVAALAGAGVGGAVGGIAGGLIGLGMPEIEAKRYEKEIKEGRMLLSVRCVDPRFSGTARTILSETDARDVFETEERKAA